MFVTYPGIFIEDKNGAFTVIFPDLNHLATCGYDWEETMSMATDCLAGYIYSEDRDGNEIPPPTPINKVDPLTEDLDAENDPDIVRVFVKNVRVEVEEYARKHFKNYEPRIDAVLRYA